MIPARTVESWALAGLTTTTTDGTRVVFVTPTDQPPDDGTSGVREPRRPAPTPPSLTAAAQTG